MFKDVIIHKVLVGSIAHEMGIEKGDKLISINGMGVNDVFDYRYNISCEEVMLEVLKQDGEIWELEIEKDAEDDLGIEFDNPLISDEKTCKNKCIFCFIDQLPEGMRETLYVKDDDARLSFLTGNYVTLTNMTEEDYEGIIKYKLSPINVSVHTTNKLLRKHMLGIKKIPDVIEGISRLINYGITINCQIVLCKGINDGIELERTLNDLTKFNKGMSSISLVPVGLTKYRKGLYNLTPYDTISSGIIIEQIEKHQGDNLKEFGRRLVYAADEFYINSNRNMPNETEYEDFAQLENGVGMISKFKGQFVEALKSSNRKARTGKTGIITGTLAANFINELINSAKSKGIEAYVKVFDIKNNFFGEMVSVSGLVTGKDIISQLSNKIKMDRYLVPENMLRAGDDVFLDDYSVKMLEEELGSKIEIVSLNGLDLLNSITE